MAIFSIEIADTDVERVINAVSANYNYQEDINGSPNQENKYEFPPPVADVLYFGTCILVNTNRDLKIQEWKDIYDKLMGGFEDLDDISDEEDDEDTNLEIGSDGYARDGFVVDEEEEEVVVKKKKVVRQPKEIETNYLDCQSELSEEEYLKKIEKE